MSTFAFLFSEMVQYNHGRVTALTQLHEKSVSSDKKYPPPPLLLPPPPVHGHAFISMHVLNCPVPKHYSIIGWKVCNTEKLTG